MKGLVRLAVLVLLTVWLPALSPIILPLCGLALALGVTGLVIAIITGEGHAFPIAGCEVGGIASFVALIWVVIVPGIPTGVREVVSQIARAQDKTSSGPAES